MSDLHPHRYGAHGLTLRSNRELAGMLPPIDGAPEVTLDFAGVGVPASAAHAPFAATSGCETLWHLDDWRWLLRYDHPREPGEAWSIAIDRERLTVCWTAGIPFSDIPPALAGAGLGAMLLIRGIPPLHASAIDVGGAAIVIMGDSGAGKSTTAAAFIRGGHKLLADDTAALEIREERVLVHPGLPRLRVHADSARALGWTTAELPRVFASDYNAKKWYIDGGGTSAEAVPVKAMYLLRQRDASRREPRIQAVAPRDALAVLLRNAYGMPLLDDARRARLFQAFGSVAERVPIREVQAPDSLELLPRLVDRLVADA